MGGFVGSGFGVGFAVGLGFGCALGACVGEAIVPSVADGLVSGSSTGVGVGSIASGATEGCGEADSVGGTGTRRFSLAPSAPATSAPVRVAATRSAQRARGRIVGVRRTMRGASGVGD